MSQGQIREEGTLLALIDHGWYLVPGADVAVFLQTGLFLSPVYTTIFLARYLFEFDPGP